MLDAARRSAKETLLNRAIVPVEAETYEAFIARLDAPQAPNDKLRRTMQTPPPWK
jgi:uncharacterized protein (DUF1778 family)